MAKRSFNSIIKAGLSSVLGVGAASMAFCLPCWIPVLVFLNSLGLTGLLNPTLAPLIKAVPLLITSGVIGWLGSRRQGLLGCAFSMAAWCMPGYWALGGYAALGVLLWKAKKTECKIVR